MKLFILILFIVLTISPAYSGCSKKITEDKVHAICKEISDKGAAIKSKWPKALLFKNCGDNYVWVQQALTDGETISKMIMHPILPRLNNRDITNGVDEYRFPLTVEFNKAAKANIDGAWVDYDWPKIGGEKAMPKTAFLQICKLPTGKSWLLGSGIWKDDFK